MDNTVLDLPGTSKDINENTKPSSKTEIPFDNFLNIINVPRDRTINPHSDGLGVLLLEALSSHDDNSISHINADTNEKITYKQYYLKSVSIALNLLNKRIQPNDIVAVYAPNVIETDYIFCATQFIGNKIAPIDPMFNDISYLLKKLEPKILFCWFEYIAKVEKVLIANGLQTEIIIMGCSTISIYNYLRLEDFFVETKRENSFKAVSVESLFDTAVILFTNGVRPKPVEINHYGLIVQNLYIQDKFNCSYTLVASPPSWIISLIFLIVSTVTGGTKICTKNFSIKNYMAILSKFQVTCSFLSPYEINLILKDLEETETTNLKNGTIEDKTPQNIIMSGAIIQKELFCTIKDLLPNTKIKLIYSVTENSGFVTMFGVDDNDIGAEGEIVSCGYGLPGMSYKIKDIQSDTIMGPNKLGELRFRSDTIMNGYYNNTNATVKAFDLDGYFCTKDLGFYDDNYAFYIADKINVKSETSSVNTLNASESISDTKLQSNTSYKKRVSFKDLIEVDSSIPKPETSFLDISVIVIPSIPMQ